VGQALPNDHRQIVALLKESCDSLEDASFESSLFANDDYI